MRAAMLWGAVLGVFLACVLPAAGSAQVFLGETAWTGNQAIVREGDGIVEAGIDAAVVVGASVGRRRQPVGRRPVRRR